MFPGKCSGSGVFGSSIGVLPWLKLLGEPIPDHLDLLPGGVGVDVAVHDGVPGKIQEVQQLPGRVFGLQAQVFISRVDGLKGESWKHNTGSKSQCKVGVGSVAILQYREYNSPRTPPAPLSQNYTPTP